MRTIERVDPETATAVAGQYNYKHFTPGTLLRDMGRTVRAAGPAPGELAPDFTRPTVDGRVLALSRLRGAPVLLHFGSPT